jgi:hypothetical protein
LVAPLLHLNPPSCQRIMNLVRRELACPPYVLSDTPIPNDFDMGCLNRTQPVGST